MWRIGGAGRRVSSEPRRAPISSAQLERYRLGLRRQPPGHTQGAHTVRRRGQSLEFREFRPYVFGDDIRHVDWRASRRAGRANEYLVRTFELETQTRVVISIDARASMRLPSAAPKLEMACWLAEALAYVAARSGDRIALHDLFAPAAQSAIDLGHTTDRARIRRALRHVLLRHASTSALGPMARVFPPASIWLVISDLYFETSDDVDRVVARMRQAQDGARWVILFELDSWPHEMQLLATGRRRIDGPGAGTVAPRIEVTPDTLSQVAERIDRRRRELGRAQKGGLSRSRWSWPASTAPAADQLFRHCFFTDPVIRQLIIRDATP